MNATFFSKDCVRCMEKTRMSKEFGHPPPKMRNATCSWTISLGL